MLTPHEEHESNYKNNYQDNPEKSQLGNREVLEREKSTMKVRFILKKKKILVKNFKLRNVNMMRMRMNLIIIFVFFCKKILTTKINC